MQWYILNEFTLCMYGGQHSKLPWTSYSSFKKRVIRLVCGVPWRTHTVTLFHSLNALDVQQLYEYNVSLLMYKYHRDMLPPVMDIFVVHDYSTRQADLLHLPSCRTELAKRSFKYKATVIWNQLKTHYFDHIMGAMASQITSIMTVFSTVLSGAEQRKHQSSASLAFVWGIQRWSVNSPHKWPVTRKYFHWMTSSCWYEC